RFDPMEPMLTRGYLWIVSVDRASHWSQPVDLGGVGRNFLWVRESVARTPDHLPSPVGGGKRCPTMGESTQTLAFVGLS
ncbi:MAG: hypothetical protein ACOYMP_02230, partial [Nodosilinea sp.]